MQTPYDINLSRKNNKLGGAILYAKALYPLHRKLKGYDIVALNDPNFMSLRPERLEKLFQRLKRENGNIFYTAMSTDIFYLNMLEDKNSPLRYSEWFVQGIPSRWHLQEKETWDNWHNTGLRNYQELVFSNIKGAVSVLYEYWEGLKYGLPVEKIGYGGIPINTSSIKPVKSCKNGRIKILLGRDKSRIALKGTDLLEEAALKVVSRHKNIAELEIVENLPYNEFIRKLEQADIILDQIYSYTPSTTPLIAMAMGKTVVTGAEPEYYDFIGEQENHPIVNAPLTVEELENTIEKLIIDPDAIEERGEKSREFVVKHNDYRVVARRFLDFWTKRMG